AVNCILRDGNQLIGENTDGKGFVQSLRTVTDPRGKSVVILGAGGAARAIAVETALAGATDFIIVNRTSQRGEELTALLKDRLGVSARFVPWSGSFRVPQSTDILIQSTSIGLFPDVEARVPIDVDSLRQGMIVADVIPNPPRTRLVRDAESRGCI